MKQTEKLIEIESLLENLLKSRREGSLLRMKILFFSSIYENLSVGMIIDKLGIKKTNFAFMTASLEKEGLIVIKKSKMDKRCRVIELTDKGHDELNGYMKELEKIYGPTPPEVDYALDVMSKYLNKIL